MKTYDYSASFDGPMRSHPWQGASADPASRYFDLRKNPALIRTSLEDLLPWSAWPAIETFYGLLEWINGADSILESNDCAFSGPSANETPQFPQALESTGRLMILWQHLPSNLSEERAEWLKGALHQSLNEMDESFELGVIGMTLFPTRYVTLPLPEKRQRGFQLILSFWCWGDTEEEVMENLDRTLRNMWRALREVDREVQKSART